MQKLVNTSIDYSTVLENYSCWLNTLIAVAVPWGSLRKSEGCQTCFEVKKSDSDSKCKDLYLRSHREGFWLTSHGVGLLVKTMMGWKALFGKSLPRLCFSCCYLPQYLFCVYVTAKSSWGNKEGRKEILKEVTCRTKGRKIHYRNEWTVPQESRTQAKESTEVRKENYPQR